MYVNVPKQVTGLLYLFTLSIEGINSTTASSASVFAACYVALNSVIYVYCS